MYGCSIQHAPLTHQFTGKEGDNESTLDYFGARYYSSPLGRFMSVDPDNRGAVEVICPLAPRTESYDTRNS